MSHLLPPFELDSRQHPVPRLLALRVMELRDVIKQILPGFVPCSRGSPTDPFALERLCQNKQA